MMNETAGRVFAWTALKRALHALPLVVREGDSLRRNLEVDHRGGGRRAEGQGHAGGLLHGLGACQRLHLHGAQVPHVAGCGDKHI